MEIKVLRTSEELGKHAAEHAAKVLKQSIAEKGKARVVLSTGASQFDMLKALIHTDVDWSKVEMFHLDEYVGLSESHPASFRNYLKERFVHLVNLKKAYFVEGEGDPQHIIDELTAAIRQEPIDLGMIGIGENAHIAFNDPPADFDAKEAYITVDLDEACKQQQVGEGWFGSVDDVPKQAISMTVHQILQCNTIISCVPYKVKAHAIKLTLENELTNHIPATALKTHPNWTLYLDEDSASALDQEDLN